MPHFGNFKDKIHEIKQSYYQNADLLDVNGGEKRNGDGKNVIEADKVKKIKDVIGYSLNKIGAYNSLNNREQVVALIDEVRRECLLCLIVTYLLI